MSGNTDILIVGGTELPPVTGSKKVRQVRLDFAGLCEAYSLLPEVETVITVFVYPDSGIPTMSAEEVFNSFVTKEGVYPILDKLAQFEAENYDATQGVLTLEQRLERLPEDKLSDFIIQAFDIATGFVSERTAEVVRGGAKAYLLYPEPAVCASDGPRIQIHPGAPDVSIDYDNTWSAHVHGKYAWLLEGIRPSVRFSKPDDPDYYLPPFVQTLPPNTEGLLYKGAVDRGGGCRVINLVEGRGEFVFTSALALGNLLTRLCSEAQDDATAPRVGNQAPSWIPEVSGLQEVAGDTATGPAQPCTAKPARKKRKPVTVKDAAIICTRSETTIKKWERGEGTPDNWPGRNDVIALRAFAETRKSQRNFKAAIKNAVRSGNMDTLTHRSLGR